VPELRRRGFARALLDDAEEHARAQTLACVFLEVRRGNRAAIRLYRSVGYEVVGVRQRYYSDDGEDALVMKHTLDAR
jgi:ribosomal-protein-alanine N-acetyltransferase